MKCLLRFRPSVALYDFVAQIQSTRRNQKLKFNFSFNGTKDLQVSVGEAELLKKSKPDAELVIIDAMNHVFKIKEIFENMKSYNDPNLPISAQLLNTITRFMRYNCNKLAALYD
jgi:fermentation-respiration switch protein FrsA (DUF1100 family)